MSISRPHSLYMFFPHLVQRVGLARPGSTIIVETEVEKNQVEAMLRQQYRTDVKVVLQKREDYDGEPFIVDLDV